MSQSSSFFFSPPPSLSLSSKKMYIVRILNAGIDRVPEPSLTLSKELLRSGIPFDGIRQYSAANRTCTTLEYLIITVLAKTEDVGKQIRAIAGRIFPSSNMEIVLRKENTREKAPPMLMADFPSGRVSGTLYKWHGEMGFGFILYNGGATPIDVFAHIENIVLQSPLTPEERKSLGLRSSKFQVTFSFGENLKSKVQKLQAIDIRDEHGNPINPDHMFLKNCCITPTRTVFSPEAFAALARAPAAPAWAPAWAPAAPADVLDAPAAPVDTPADTPEDVSMDAPAAPVDVSMDALTVSAAPSSLDVPAVPVLVISREKRIESILFATDLKEAILLASLNNNPTVSVSHVGVFVSGGGLPFSKFSAVSEKEIIEFTTEEELDTFMSSSSSSNLNRLTDLVEFH